MHTRKKSSTCLQMMQAHSIYESSLSWLHFLILVEDEQTPVTATGRRLLRTLRRNSWEVALLGERAEWDRVAPVPAAYTNGADNVYLGPRGAQFVFTGHKQGQRVDAPSNQRSAHSESSRMISTEAAE